MRSTIPTPRGSDFPRLHDRARARGHPGHGSRRVPCRASMHAAPPECQPRFPGTDYTHTEGATKHEQAHSDRQPGPGITRADISAVVDRAAFQAGPDARRAREKAHTRECDVIAAVNCRLPMVDGDASTELIGANGSLTMFEAFERRRQLIAYYFVW
jgi:hypothetical protein